METSIIKPRRPWLAALLSLMGGPLGQIYAGHFCRSMILWAVGALLLPIVCFVALRFPLGQLSLAILSIVAIAFPIFLVVDAFRLARRERYTPLKRYQRWWVYIFAYVALFAASDALANLVRTYLVEAFVIPSRGMSPTILAGERILVDKNWTHRHPLQRNDLVVYRSEGPNSPLFVMRVVGLPGDEIAIKNEQVIVNGTEWDDRHAVFQGRLPLIPEIANYGPVKIPQDSFFVLGDNRRISNDSRLRGPIPLADLYGKARMIYWPRERQFPDPNDTTRYTLGQ